MVSQEGNNCGNKSLGETSHVTNSNGIVHNPIVPNIREQWYYNNGQQEVVKSIQFCEKKDKYFAKLLGFKPMPAGPSQIFSLVLY